MKARQFGRKLAALIATRFLFTSTSRLIFPFLPELARGLNVSIDQLARLLSIRSLMGLLGPVLGTLSERFGRKPLLIISTAVFSTALFVLALVPQLSVFVAMLAIVSLANLAFDPTMRAYISDNVSYAERGKALGWAEISWSAALLVGAPVAGVLIARQGWRSPFLWLAILGLLAIGLLLVVISAESDPSQLATAKRLSYSDMARAAVQNRPLRFALLFIFLMMGANQLIFIFYGDWLERSFGLSVSSLGIVAAVIGLADLSGELLAGPVADRFGKRPTITVAALVAATAYVLLPRAEGLTIALALMYAAFVGFETTFIAVMPIFSELMPAARSVSLSLMSMVMSLGRALSLWSAPSLRTLFDGSDIFRPIGILAAGVTLLGVLVLWLGVEEISTQQGSNR